MATLDQIVNAKAIALGKLAVQATTAAGSGHPTTALSLAHLTAFLMYRAMRWDPKTPRNPASDRLVLSEGHAVPIVYAACADLGVMFEPKEGERALTVDDLSTLRAIDSPLDGHPNPPLGFPFFDAATGSLGQGLSVAAGLAAAARLDAIDKLVYCIIGDGESREGQIWEAMDFIADHKLSNVVAIFNANTLGQSDFVDSAQDWQHLQKKAEAFGWNVVVIDGHSPSEMAAALERRTEQPGTPLCIVARTVKGWGVADLGGMGHHGTAVPKDKLAAILAALDERAKALGADKIDPAESAEVLRVRQPQAAPKAAATKSTPIGFDAAIRAEKKVAETLESKKVMAPRRAYGLALKALGAANPAVVALDGDVKNSTHAEDFAKAYPERYFEGRIAEQNMVSAGVGLAAGGKIPFVSTFGKFLVRAYDQVEMAIIGGADLKLVGSHVGVTLASDGPSQMALSDVAFMRGFAHVIDHRGNPAMTILTPSDAVGAYAMTLAMAEYPSACYLRTVRADLPLLYHSSESFPLRGHKLPHPGRAAGNAVLIVSTGYLVHSCIEAAKALDAMGKAAAVLDAYSLPMDTEAVLDLARRNGGRILCVEDNYVGGVGSELAEAAAASEGGPRVICLNVRNLPKSGRSPDDVLAYVHLSVAEIAAAAEALIA